MPDVKARVVVVHEGKVLLIHHQRRGHTYWVVPGGGARDMETLEAAAVREVREETGLQIQPGPLVAVFETRSRARRRWIDIKEAMSSHVVELVFLAESFTGALSAPSGGVFAERHDLAEFVDTIRLPSLEIRPAQLRPLLAQLASGVRPIPRYLGDLTDESLEESQ
jgi:ADP-ribose pyrophosphatase YjhB (NUDIX family)